MISFREYEELVNDRPEKFEPEEVNYRKARDKERCSRCIHFFVNRIRPEMVCEIMRPDNDEDVDPNWVCNLFTHDGEDYPLFQGRNGEPEEA